jgi:hypothetical protein
MSAEARDPTQLQAHWLTRGRGLDGGNKRRLAGSATASLAAGPFAADIGVVHLDAPLQWLAGVAFHHHLRQLVLDLPGGGLRHAEAAAQFDAGDALLALCQVIHRPEPGPQRQMGRREDRAGNRRGLAAAGVALEQPAGRHLAVCPAAAGRAYETIRPS